MKHLLPALRFKIFMLMILGVAYPLLVTAIAGAAFNQTAGGSLIEKDGHVVGSKLLAQKFEKPRYFWPRPSAVDFNPLPSGGSNLGQASGDLKKAYDERKAKLMAANPDAGDPPTELLFASASGLDPQLSPRAALYQSARVAKARGLSREQVNLLVEKFVEPRQFGVFGEPTVNVLALNLALDETGGRTGESH